MTWWVPEYFTNLTETDWHVIHLTVAIVGIGVAIFLAWKAININKNVNILGTDIAQENIINNYYSDKRGFYDGRQVDDKKINKLIKLAEQGDAEAQFDLAGMYRKGRGVDPNYEKAVEWYTKSADQGHIKAQFNIAVMYQEGKGVEQNYAKAFEWFMKSAEKYDASSLLNIGFMYENGQGVEQSDEKAIKWYTESAEDGDANAQYNLAVMYIKGRGVAKNYMNAHMWASLSAINNHEKGGVLRDRITNLMTPEQIVEAQRLFIEWND